MGIPDTYTMPISEYNSQIFIARATAEQTTTTSNSSTQDHLPPCTQVFCTVLFNYKKDKEQPVSLNPDSSSKFFTCEDVKKVIHIKKFTAAEIKKATGNYRKQNIIGKGGQGTVYKGILSPSNQLIAVKRTSLTDKSKFAKDQFVHEIHVLSQINHKNVVKLLGCCFEKDIPSIVYEFIPNLTLYDHLFDKKNPCVLTWNHRLRIASQVAQALAYLHDTTMEPIIHRDIKSRNILLDDNFMAKVSDFGISIIGPCPTEFNTFVEHEWESHQHTTLVMGTLGYLDPEYLTTSGVSMKSDIYSFGVVLAELLTRKKAVYDECETGESGCVESETGEPSSAKNMQRMELLSVTFLKKLMDDSWIEILDEQLVNEGTMEQLKKVVHLAGRCLEKKGKDRPTMRQVVTDLEDISRI